MWPYRSQEADGYDPNMLARRVTAALTGLVVAGLGSAFAIRAASSAPARIGTVFYSGEGCAGLAQAGAASYRLRATTGRCYPVITGGNGYYDGWWTNDDGSCDPIHAVPPPSVSGARVSQLVGYSLGRLGPIYFLADAPKAEVADVNSIELLDPGTKANFSSCDTNPAVDPSGRLAAWLASNANNSLTVLAGTLTATDGYAALLSTYLAAIPTDTFRRQVHVCGVAQQYASHEAIQHFLSLIGQRIASCPTGSSTATSLYPPQTLPTIPNSVPQTLTTLGTIPETTKATLPPASPATASPATSPEPSSTPSGSAPTTTSSTTASPASQPPTSSAAPTTPSSGSTEAITGVTAAQVSPTSYTVSWVNPGDPTIAGWIVTQQGLDGAASETSGASYPDPAASTETNDTSTYEAQFQPHPGDTWEICVTPFGQGLVNGNYPEMTARTGCSSPFTWHA